MERKPAQLQIHKSNEEVRKYAMITWMDRGWKYSFCTLEDTVFSDIRFGSEDEMCIQDIPHVLKSFYIYTPFYHAKRIKKFRIYILTTQPPSINI